MRIGKTLSSTHGISQVVEYAIDAVLEKRMDKVKIARKNFSHREFTIFTQVYDLMIENLKLIKVLGRLRILDEE